MGSSSRVEGWGARGARRAWLSASAFLKCQQQRKNVRGYSPNEEQDNTQTNKQ